MNGTTDEMVLANESNFDFERTDPFSLVLFLKASGTGVEDFLNKRDISGGGSFPGWLLRFLDGATSDDDLSLFFRGSGGDSIAVDVENVDIRNGVYRNIIMTYDGSSNASGVNMYIDGTLQTMVTSVDTLSTSMLTNVAVQLGVRENGSQFFAGDMAEVTIYDVELTANECRALGNGVSPFAIRNSAIKAFLPLYGNDSPEVDYSGDNNDATLIGTTKSAHSPTELLENYL